jgi:hypothetical protein
MNVIAQALLMGKGAEIFPLPYRLEFGYANWLAAVAAYEALGFVIPPRTAAAEGVADDSIFLASTWIGDGSSPRDSVLGEPEASYIWFIADLVNPLDVSFTVPTSMYANTVTYDYCANGPASSVDVIITFTDASTNTRNLIGGATPSDMARYTDGPFSGKTIQKIVFRCYDLSTRKFLTNLNFAAS